MDFEKKLLELEDITCELEGKNTSIEDGIMLFEKSLILARECAEFLTETKGKITEIKNELDKLLSDALD